MTDIRFHRCLRWMLAAVSAAVFGGAMAAHAQEPAAHSVSRWRGHRGAL